MNILHVSHGYPPSIGGVQLLIQNLSEHLVRDYGDQVTVFTTNAYGTEHFWHGGGKTMPVGLETINGVTVRRFPVFAKFSFLRQVLSGIADRLNLSYKDWLRTIHNGPIIFGLSQAIAQSQADLVLAGSFPLLHMYQALAGAKKANIPIALLGAIHPLNRWAFERPMMFKAIQRAEAYIALTPYEHDYLVERGIKRQKIHVIGAGVDIAPFIEATGETIRTRYGWRDKPVVSIIAKQTERKRFDILLEAMQVVWRGYPEVKLLLAGAHGPYSDQLTKQIQGLSDQERQNVTLIHDFSNAEKAELLAASDIFVLPSGEESFGIAFIEAWACRKPVIGAAVGAIASLIEHGRDGLLIPYGKATDLAEAIMTLLTKPERGQAMGEMGYRKVEAQYTWDSVTAEFRNVYQNLIGR